MPDRSPQDTRRRADLFSVPCGPLSDDDIIEWSDDEAEAAAIMADARRIGKQYRALRRESNGSRWVDASVKVVMAVRYYLEAHADAVPIVNGRAVYSDGFRRFVLALADVGRPGYGMPLNELAFATMVPQAILKDWLSSQSDA